MSILTLSLNTVVILQYSNNETFIYQYLSLFCNSYIWRLVRMKQVQMERTERGDTTLEDVIVVEDGMVTHRQIEHRNGKTFMRAKKRELAVEH